MLRSTITLPQFERFLLQATDLLRGKLDASEQLAYLFGLLFLKRISDIHDESGMTARCTARARGNGTLGTSLNERVPGSTVFVVPPEAQWFGEIAEEPAHCRPGIVDLTSDIGSALNQALRAVEDANPILTGVFRHINYTAQVQGRRKVSDQDLKLLIEHFSQPGFVLVNANFAFPDLLGAAYECLLGFWANRADKRSGQFYTPGSVARLMVRLLRPHAGMRVYDPTVGSGGLLIQVVEYVRDQGGNPTKLTIYGQECHPIVAAICKMNLLLHNVTNFNIAFGDTLVEPLHLMHGDGPFDLVLANPPFSQNYQRRNLQHPERFAYGWTPETAKADLMFLQHILYSFNANGMAAVVLPHGVLFRGGIEKQIRQQLLTNDGGVIQAIIGLPPKLFYGTGIPTVLLILKKNKPPAMRDKVVIINAEHACDVGTSYNTLRAEDIAKIDDVYTHAKDVPGFARVVDVAEIQANDWNLSLRRYVDPTPVPEPLDLRALLVGGVPRSELAAHADQLARCGIDPMLVFQDRDADAHYVDFRPEISGVEQVRALLAGAPAVQRIQNTIHERLTVWWSDAQHQIAALAVLATREQSAERVHYRPEQGRSDLPAIRQALADSVRKQLVPLGVLDQYQVEGVFVSWWESLIYDLKTIAAHGWNPALIPHAYLIQAMFPADAAHIAALESAVSAAEAVLDDAVAQVRPILDDDEDEDEDVADTCSSATITARVTLRHGASPTPACDTRHPDVTALDALHRAEQDVRDARRALKHCQEQVELKLWIKKVGPAQAIEETRERFKQEPGPTGVHRIDAALRRSTERPRRKGTGSTLSQHIEHVEGVAATVGGQITQEETRELLLRFFYDQFVLHLDRALAAEQRATIAVVENLWEKYGTSLATINAESARAQQRVNHFLAELGYLK